MRYIIALAALALAVTQTAVAAETMTVQSLINDGYTISGYISSRSGGAGVFLLKDKALIMCAIAETPTSATVATVYCKPVK